MPTELGREFAPIKIFIPPHMAAEDTALYHRWAPSGLKGALRQFFDVALGDGPEFPEGAPLELEPMWIRLNQKRADAIVEYPEKISLIEFRYNATPNVFGRLITYEMLWKDDPVINKELELVVVTNREDPVMTRVAKSLNVVLVVL